MIQVDNLVKRFGSIRALDDVSFTVERGDVVGLLGPNGAGKTTAMRIITGAMPPTEGRVEIAGLDVADDPVEVKRRVGYLPEVPPLYPEMTVAGFLGFVAELKGVPRDRRRVRVEEAMELCAVSARADQTIDQLSKGFRQRVGLAQAILHRPEVLILDEPTTGLDPRQIIEVRKLIRDLAGERTVVLSSHILSEVAATCSRVIVMNRGRVVATDTPSNLTRRLTGGEQLTVTVRGPGDAVRERLEEVEGVDAVEMIEGPDGAGAVRYGVISDPDRDVRSGLAAAVVQGGWELLELRRAELSLEEIFLRLTTESGRAGDADDGGSTGAAVGEASVDDDRESDLAAVGGGPGVER